MPKPYQIAHYLFGVVIGMGGIMGLPAALFVIYREYNQETETLTAEGKRKAITNKAWRDMTEWASGVITGLAIHIAAVVLWLL